MQIIANNCIGGYLYNESKMQFQTPFIWSLIDFENYIKLVEQIRNIDLNKSLIKINKETKTVIVNINNIQINFIHHFEDERYIKPFKSGNNVKCKNIIECYFKNIFYERVNRFKKDRGMLFILDECQNGIYNAPLSLENLRTFSKIQIDKKDLKIITTRRQEAFDLMSKNCLIINTNKVLKLDDKAKIIYKTLIEKQLISHL